MYLYRFLQYWTFDACAFSRQMQNAQPTYTRMHTAFSRSADFHLSWFSTTFPHHSPQHIETLYRLHRRNIAHPNILNLPYSPISCYFSPPWLYSAKSDFSYWWQLQPWDSWYCSLQALLVYWNRLSHTQTVASSRATMRPGRKCIFRITSIWGPNLLAGAWAKSGNTLRRGRFMRNVSSFSWRSSKMNRSGNFTAQTRTGTISTLYISKSSLSAALASSKNKRRKLKVTIQKMWPT